MKRGSSTAMRGEASSAPRALVLGPRQVAWFIIKVLVIYALLMTLWPALDNVYAAGLRDAGNLLFGSFTSRGKVEFRAAPADDPAGDTEVVLTNLERKRSASFKQKSYLVGYKPTVSLLALVLATPLRWERRLRALAWGLLLVHGFVALRMGLGIANDFCTVNPIALYKLHPFLGLVLRQSVVVLLDAPAIYYVAPAFIWLLVTFRRNDWAVMFGKKVSAHC